jgi:hypothetical protein
MLTRIPDGQYRVIKRLSNLRQEKKNIIIVFQEPVIVSLQRRNSAPEIGEPLPFLDDGSMEL